MIDDHGWSVTGGQDFNGNHPVAAETAMRDLGPGGTITVNRCLYLRSQQFERMLVDAPDLQALLETLLLTTPRLFEFDTAELWLHDPENNARDLISGGRDFGRRLQLHRDSLALRELYDHQPRVELLDATDARMFEVLKSDPDISHALLLPLVHAGSLIGSIHLGLVDPRPVQGKAETELLGHLAEMISASLVKAARHVRVSSLATLDPVTSTSNLRGFERDLKREVARSHREQRPLSVLYLDIDEYDDLLVNYGPQRAQLVQKKVVERIARSVRATDVVGVLPHASVALLVSGCMEEAARSIGEKLREDIAAFSIDDGWGAVLQVTVSVGVATWDPQRNPVEVTPHLTRQLDTVAHTALNDARAGGGNRVAVCRLDMPAAGSHSTD